MRYNILVKKILVWTLIFLCVVALLLRFSNKIAETFLGVKQTSGISLLSDPTDAAVFLDGREVGKTPFESSDLDVKEYTVKIEKNNAFWQGRIKLNASTVVVIKRDISADPTSAAGEILTLIRGKGITVISNPIGAQVEIDGKVYGKTPITVDESVGEHTISVSRTNYLNRNIKADLPANFNLIISVDLALSEADLTVVQTPSIAKTPEVIVKKTPTGFLRVRDKPSLAGKEVAQVKPEEMLILLEELGGWYRVRLSSGIEGYVSSSYVEKKTQEKI